MTTHIDPDRAASIAKFQADMAEWHARPARAKAYWKAHPCKPLGEPKWPAPPTRSYNKAYYEGGYRMVIDGVPIRLAAHVKSWPARAKAALGKGTLGYKEQQELERQAMALGLVKPPAARDDGDFECVHCHRLFNFYRGNTYDFHGCAFDRVAA